MFRRAVVFQIWRYGRGRNLEHDWSRMGYNGKQKDDEVYGKGNFTDYGARGMDNRIIRWITIDKKPKPSFSLYQFGKGNPIAFIDPDGNTEYYFNGEWVASDGVPNNTISITNNKEVATKIKAGTYTLPPEAERTTSSSTPDLFFIDATVLHGADAVLKKQGTEAGKSAEFGTRLNRNAEGKYEMVPEGIVKVKDFNPGDEEAKVNIPGKGGVSIHGHPYRVDIEVVDENEAKVGGFDASQPGPQDMDGIEDEDYSIIVGKIGEASAGKRAPFKTDPPGTKAKWVPTKRKEGISVFDKNNREKPMITISKDDATNILKDYDTKRKK